MRLAIGVGLQKLAVASGYQELAFASLHAYAAERCGWSTRWVQQARLLARKSEEWPALRNALISGQISWSMALEVVKVATAESIGQWLQISGRCTVGTLEGMSCVLSSARCGVDEARDQKLAFASLHGEPREIRSRRHSRLAASFAPRARTIAQRHSSITFHRSHL